jgi:hypothetical protein
VPDYTKAVPLGQGIGSIIAHEEWILSVFAGWVKKNRAISEKRIKNRELRTA